MHRQHAFLSVLLGALLAFHSADAAHYLQDYGGVPGDDSNAAAEANTQALISAILAANASSTDRVVMVRAGEEFTVFNATVFNIHNFTLHVDGELRLSNNMTAEQWPEPIGNANNFALLAILQSTDIEFTGSGVINGQGYLWWWKVILGGGKDYRPHLIVMDTVAGIRINGGLHFINSAQFHLRLKDVRDVEIRDIEIYVNVEGQKNLFITYGHWDLNFNIPTFPLNTDGIDPSGVNVLIDNVTITNYDDAVAVKPYTGEYGECSQNMLIQNSRVFFGVGMTIGSVPSDDKCVRNITFQNITFDHAIKAIYVKTNPGDPTKRAYIDNVTYRDITGTNSLWYPIWIGPQQQHQPGRNGTGCSFFYPIVDTCPTNPLVPISNITLENIHFSGPLQWTLPGVIICNASNPCRDFVFKNVTNSGSFIVSKHYRVENVFGTSENCDPAPKFASEEDEPDQPEPQPQNSFRAERTLAGVLRPN